MRERPRKMVKLHGDRRPPVVVASDAQADQERPSGGFLAVDDHRGTKVAAWCDVQGAHLEAWGFTQEALRGGANPIQVCEAAMLPWGLIQMGPDRLRGRNVVWLIDNTSALYAAVKGSSRHPAVARAVAFASFAAFFWGFSIWYEFVDSEANWADGISRRRQEDEFCARNGFVPVQMRADEGVWQGTLQDMWRAFQEQRWG